jgi:hypothetical protein
MCNKSNQVGSCPGLRGFTWPILHGGVEASPFGAAGYLPEVAGIVLVTALILQTVKLRGRVPFATPLATAPLLVHSDLRLILLSRIDGDAPRA